MSQSTQRYRMHARSALKERISVDAGKSCSAKDDLYDAIDITGTGASQPDEEFTARNLSANIKEQLNSGVRIYEQKFYRFARAPTPSDNEP